MLHWFVRPNLPSHPQLATQRIIHNRRCQDKPAEAVVEEAEGQGFDEPARRGRSDGSRQRQPSWLSQYLLPQTGRGRGSRAWPPPPPAATQADISCTSPQLEYSFVPTFATPAYSLSIDPLHTPAHLQMETGSESSSVDLMMSFPLMDNEGRHEQEEDMMPHGVFKLPTVHMDGSGEALDVVCWRLNVFQISNHGVPRDRD